MKLIKLRKFIEDKGRKGVIVAFSGGVDSTTLAVICKEILKDVVAVTVKSEVIPERDLKDAEKIARDLGLEHHILEISLLSDEDFARNTVGRCYFCKRLMIRAMKGFGRDIGIETIFEGTNVSDLKGHRPGYRAIVEENVYVPWVEAGFTKEEIRTLAKEMGLPVHDKPSSTCLATRIPFNERITLERLRRIEKAEEIVKAILKLRVVRVRDHGNMARIEVGKDEMTKIFDVEVMDRIAKELKKIGYRYVTLDLEGYREGSMLDQLHSYNY